MRELDNETPLPVNGAGAAPKAFKEKPAAFRGRALPSGAVSHQSRIATHLGLAASNQQAQLAEVVVICA